MIAQENHVFQKLELITFIVIKFANANDQQLHRLITIESHHPQQILILTILTQSIFFIENLIVTFSIKADKLSLFIFLQFLDLKKH